MIIEPFDLKEAIVVIASGLTLGASLLKMLLGPSKRLSAGIARFTPAQKVLGVFAVIVVSFGIFTLAQYWEAIKQNQDSMIFALWLFLTMVAGMFRVQPRYV